MGAEIIDSEIKIKLMQKIIQTILLLTSLTIAIHTQAQIINISDANFKGKLTNIFMQKIL